MTPVQELNPIEVPLQGRQIIEASAGTGKTYMLTALYLRLVLGHQSSTAFDFQQSLLPPQILVLTFTEVATAQLRDRIRSRLHEAALAFSSAPQPTDEFLKKLRATFPSDMWPICQQKLTLASQWMDEAAVHTIHGWSMRMLREHAFDSKHLFEQKLVEDAQALELEAVTDYWRQWFYPLTPTQAKILQDEVAASPEQLLHLVKLLWRIADKRPSSIVVTFPSPASCISNWADWASVTEQIQTQIHQLWTVDVVQALQTALANKKLNGVRSDHFAGWLNQMQQWITGADIKHDTLQRFTTQTLINKGWTDATQFSVFDDIQRLCDQYKLQPSLQDAIVQHACHSTRIQIQNAKRERAQFDFSDLLQHLYHATVSDDGRLAQAIRAQCPVALVDEFQDTDPWQYSTLHHIYYGQSNACLIMIGDPKQAIYSFRGADLPTYLKAKHDALQENPHCAHTLSGNYRSTPQLVNAINHIFNTQQSVFGQLKYIPVTAKNSNVTPLMINGQQQAAMTVFYYNTPHDKPIKPAAYQQFMANQMAQTMAQLLQDGHAKKEDFAVLVRSYSQAQLMREALSKRKISSVYLSDKESVYKTQEALDLWTLLRAINQPRSLSQLRCALATRLWGLSVDQLHQLLMSNKQLDIWQEQMNHWHQIWKSQGLLAMLHQCLHASGASERLMAHAMGERRLGNLLHLGELLQRASIQLQGTLAVERYLHDQCMSRTSTTDEAQMRLESDADRIPIITYHKSKGLEFPLVMMPFLSGFKIPKDDSSTDDESEDDDEGNSVDEDLRLIYVGLTRAQRSIWVGMSSVSGEYREATNKKPEAWNATSQLFQRKSRLDALQQLQSLWGNSISDIQIKLFATDAIPDFTTVTPTQTEWDHNRLLIANPRNTQRWWTASFSAISKHLDLNIENETTRELLSNEDETEQAMSYSTNQLSPTSISAWQAFPAGASYGLLLHELLEWQCLHQWPIYNPKQKGEKSDAWQILLDRKKIYLQLKDEDVALIEPWLQTIIHHSYSIDNTQQPLVLGQLQAQQCWAEMQFHLPVHRINTQAIDSIITSSVFPTNDRPPLQSKTMHGMLTGVIDLVCEHNGRYWVIDYKSNKLNDYDDAHLLKSVLSHRYDLQYVLYTLALHRLLRSRLANYNYETHMGGAIYLYLRGINHPSSGLHFHRPSFDLIDHLDSLFRADS
ncbi:MAG: exodeoxyribonuclease V subunit beta [Limnohabitans sp.]|nr:exodeoxyribonuclease V subunit beta [Limnohabitans sp.]